VLRLLWGMVQAFDTSCEGKGGDDWVREMNSLIEKAPPAPEPMLLPASSRSLCARLTLACGGQGQGAKIGQTLVVKQQQGVSDDAPALIHPLMRPQNPLRACTSLRADGGAEVSPAECVCVDIRRQRGR